MIPRKLADSKFLPISDATFPGNYEELRAPIFVKDISSNRQGSNHRTSKDDGLGCTIAETKRTVFRFHGSPF